MKSISVAIIGAGSMAREHIKAFQAQEQVKVKAIFSRTKERAENLAKEFSIEHVTSSIEELYSKSEADLVVITVPELEAAHVAKQSFLYNWSVLLEKPAGYDLKDACDIAEAAEQTKLPVFVGFNRRFYSSARAILADINSRGEDARYIRIQDQQSFEEARRYNHPEQVVEKFMYANSIHTIDLIRFFGRGEISKVEAIVPWMGAKSQIVLSYIEFSSGDKALYEGIWQGPGPWTCTVSTPSKRWLMQPLEKASFQNKDERKLNELPIAEEDTRFKAGFYLQAGEVCKALRGESSQAVTINESLKTMRLINQIFDV